tara:strand:+ start:725 stop:1165 length:441 start_codon:yes stop_codon:yes gene_type:complete
METLTTLSLITQLPTIHETIGVFYQTFEKVLNHRHSSYIKKQLFELDIQSVINSIELVITHENTIINENKILFLCTERIKQTIHEIHLILEKIQFKMEKYETDWLWFLWGFDLSCELQQLESKKNILEKRIDNFINMYLLTKKINI